MLPASLSLFFFFSTNGARRDRHRYRFIISVRSFHPRFGDNDFPCSAGARARPRDLICEFYFRDASPLRFTFFTLPLFPLFEWRSREAQEVGRFSSRHDDECCNVRLEARNSMVCSRTVYGVYYGDCPKARVYEISRLRRCSRCSLSLSHSHSPSSLLAENAKTLDLFALHFARFSSRKSASAFLGEFRCPAPRATRSRLPLALSTWRRKFACALSEARSLAESLIPGGREGKRGKSIAAAEQRARLVPSRRKRAD